MVTMTPDELARWALDHMTNDAWVICPDEKVPMPDEATALSSAELAIKVRRAVKLVVVHNDHVPLGLPTKIHVVAPAEKQQREEKPKEEKPFQDSGGALIFLGVIGIVVGFGMPGGAGFVAGAVLVSVGELIRTIGRAVRRLP